MNLNYLKYFQALAANLHYSETAEQLHISQSGLSYAISELEKELGFSLFLKKGRNIVLTEIGRIYYQSINKILEELDIVTNRALKSSSFQKEGILLGGSSTSLATELLTSFHKDSSFAGLNLIRFIRFSTSALMMKSLKEEQISFALTTIPVDDPARETLI